MKENIELINFIDLTKEEKFMILSWRNDERIRNWMYNTDVISKEDHLDFIDNLQERKDRLYFLVKEEDEYIGVIDFTNIENNIAYMGIYSNPDKKGFGEKLLDSIIYYGKKKLKLKKIIAEVYAGNKKAISLYKQKDFQSVGKKVFRENEMLIMELKNEN